jgi:hypothetical protein
VRGIGFVEAAAEKALVERPDPPGVAEEVLAAGSEEAREDVVIHPDLLVSLPPPAAPGIIDGQRHAEKTSRAGALKEGIIERLADLLAAVLALEQHGVRRKLVHGGVHDAVGKFRGHPALVRDHEAGALAKRHWKVAVALLVDVSQNERTVVPRLEAGAEEVDERARDAGLRLVVEEGAQEDLAVSVPLLAAQPCMQGLHDARPPQVGEDDLRAGLEGHGF